MREARRWYRSRNFGAEVKWMVPALMLLLRRYEEDATLTDADLAEDLDAGLFIHFHPLSTSTRLEDTMRAVTRDVELRASYMSLESAALLQSAFCALGLRGTVDLAKAIGSRPW